MYSQQGPGIGSSSDATPNGIDNIEPNHDGASVDPNVNAVPIVSGEANGTDAQGTDASASAATANAKGPNRYMKGRLPDGVDFAAYPGRSSTPLPTAESKSAERINQLKIWNEAATNDDKRRLPAGIGKNPGLGIVGTTTRRTDSYKEAKDRHSASFHGAPPPGQNPTAADMELHNHLLSTQRSIRTGAGTTALPSKGDMFADRSDSDDEDDDELDDSQIANASRGRGNPNDISQNPAFEKTPLGDQVEPVLTNNQPSDVPMEQNLTQEAHVTSPPVTQPPPQAHSDVGQIPETTSRQQPSSVPPPSTQPPPSSKQSKGCCSIM